MWYHGISEFLTIWCGGFKSNGAHIKSKRIVEQIDSTIHFCNYDHIVPHCTITVHHEIRRIMLHGALSAHISNRDSKCFR